MDREELKKKMDLLKINPNQYSLYGDLKSDAIILYPNYSKWEVFYLDERGGRNDERVFLSEQEACNYIYRLFEMSQSVAKKYGLNT